MFLFFLKNWIQEGKRRPFLVICALSLALSLSLSDLFFIFYFFFVLSRKNSKNLLLIIQLADLTDKDVLWFTLIRNKRSEREQRREEKEK